MTDWQRPARPHRGNKGKGHARPRLPPGADMLNLFSGLLLSNRQSLLVKLWGLIEKIASSEAAHFDSLPFLLSSLSHILFLLLSFSLCWFVAFLFRASCCYMVAQNGRQEVKWRDSSFFFFFLMRWHLRVEPQSLFSRVFIFTCRFSEKDALDFNWFAFLNVH